MPSYGPHFTTRVRVKYLAGGDAHNVLLRCPGPSTGSGVTDLLTAFGDFLTALAPLLYDDFIPISISVADIDTNIFLPIANTLVVAGGVGAVTREPKERATEWSFTARTTGGNPWKFSLFGLYLQGIELGGEKDFRIRFGENGDIDAAMTILNANSTAFIGNDGNPLHWAPYVDYKDNDHWVKQVRG